MRANDFQRQLELICASPIQTTLTTLYNFSHPRTTHITIALPTLNHFHPLNPILITSNFPHPLLRQPCPLLIDPSPRLIRPRRDSHLTLLEEWPQCALDTLVVVLRIKDADYRIKSCEEGLYRLTSILCSIKPRF
ncbi:hypothetical protein FNYG_08886 [Fusarium nygamai]|uniref:Uncharacterized protein n=1 Tax=Gibberella nygamai TaxID=42673 RepID=A0A2K0W699_GIBNY|nr:hypothetical protein FNYG_08886 [Fusarium nygamai]